MSHPSFSQTRPRVPFEEEDSSVGCIKPPSHEYASSTPGIKSSDQVHLAADANVETGESNDGGTVGSERTSTDPTSEESNTLEVSASEGDSYRIESAAQDVQELPEDQATSAEEAASADIEPDTVPEDSNKPSDNTGSNEETTSVVADEEPQGEQEQAEGDNEHQGDARDDAAADESIAPLQPEEDAAHGDNETAETSPTQDPEVQTPETPTSDPELQGSNDEDSGQLAGADTLSSLVADAPSTEASPSSNGLALALEESPFRKAINASPTQTVLFDQGDESNPLPVKISAKDGHFAGSLDLCDDLPAWLAQNASVSSLALTGATQLKDEGRSAKVTAVDIQVQLGSEPSEVVGQELPNNATSLSFTTLSSALGRQFSCKKYSVANLDGVHPDLDEVVAALSPDQQSKIEGILTMADLCTKCGIDLPAWVMSALQGIGIELAPATGDHYPRSAFWFSGTHMPPASENAEFHGKSLLRLEFRPSVEKAVSAIKNLLGPMIPKIDLDGFSIVYKCRAGQQDADTDPASEIIIAAAETQTKIGSDRHSVRVAASLSSTGIRVILTFDENASVKDLVQWVFDHIAARNGKSAAVPDFSQHLERFASFGKGSGASTNDIKLKQVVLSVTESHVDNISVLFLATTSFGATGGKTLPFSLKFSWIAESQQLHCEGVLLKSGDVASKAAASYLDLASHFEASTHYSQFSDPENLQHSIDIISLFPGSKLDQFSLPFTTAIPSKVEDLRLTLDVVNKRPSMKVTAVLPKPTNGKGIFSALSNLNLCFEITASDEAPKSSKFSLDGYLEADGSHTDANDQLKSRLPLDVILDKTGKSEFKVTGKDLRASFLALLLEPGHERDTLTEMLGSIVIRDLNLSYEVEGGKPQPESSFHVDADLEISKLHFQMHFVKASGKGWELNASLQPMDGKVQDIKLGALIENLASKEILAQIPDFVRQTNIPLSKFEADLSVSKTPEGHVLFHFHAKLGEFHFDFAQLKKRNIKTTDSTGQSKIDLDQGDEVIRLLRVAIGKLPSLDKIPLLDKMEQPFEQLHFAWLSHDISEDDSGLLKKGFDELAPLRFKGPDAGKRKEEEGEKKLKGKQERKAKPESSPTAKAGMHILILAKDGDQLVAVLDYAFGGKPQSNKSSHAAPGSSHNSLKPDPRDPAARKQRLGERKAALRKKKREGGNKKQIDRGSSSSQEILNLTETGESGAVESNISEVGPRSDQAGESEPQSTPSPSELAPFDKKIGPLTISALGVKYADNHLSILLDAMVQLGPLEFSVDNFAIEMSLKNVNLHDLHDMKISASLSGLGLEMKSGALSIAGSFKKIKSTTEVGFAGGLSIAYSPYSFMAAGAYLEEAAGYKTVFGFLMVSGPLMSFGWAEIRGITAGFGYNSTLRLPSISEVPAFPLMSNALPGGPDPLVQLHALTNTQGADAWIKPRNGSIWLAAGLTVKAVKLLDVQAIVTFEMGDGMKIGIIGEAVATVPPGKSPHDTGVFMAIDLDVMASLDLNKGIIQVEAQLTPSSFILSRDCHLTGGFALCSWFGSASGHQGDWVFSVGGYHPAFPRPSHYPNPPRVGISWTFDSHISISGEAYFAITPSCCMGGGKLSARCDLGVISAHFDAHADMIMMYKPFHYMLDAGVSMGVKFEMKIIFIRIRISIDIGADVRIEGPPLHGEAHVNLAIVSFVVYFGESAGPPPPLTLDEFWELLLETSSSDKQKGEVESHIIAVADGLIPTDTHGAPNHLGTIRPGSLSIQIHSRAALSSVETNATNPVKIERDAKIYSKPMQIQSPMSSKMTIDIKRGSEATSDGFKLLPINGGLPAALWGQYDHQLDGVGKNSDALHSERPSLIPHLTGVEVRPPDPILSTERIPPFSNRTLSEAAEIKGNLKESIAPEGLQVELADQNKMRALWGNGVTTANVDAADVLSKFAASVKRAKPEVASGYAGLNSNPARKLFRHYGLYYSGGEPKLAVAAKVAKAVTTATVATAEAEAVEEVEAVEEAEAEEPEAE